MALCWERATPMALMGSVVEKKSAIVGAEYSA